MIKIKPEPDIELTQEEYERLYLEWNNSQLYTALPQSFESFVRSKQKVLLNETIKS